jgi:carbon storage regulator CsrA
MALCLTRKRNESVVFKLKQGGADIKVTVVGFSPTQGVRIAIEAPNSVEIVREELMYRDQGWQGRETKHDTTVR